MSEKNLFHELNVKLDQYNETSHKERTERLKDAFDTVYITENLHSVPEHEVGATYSLDSTLLHQLVNHVDTKHQLVHEETLHENLENRVLTHLIQSNDVHELLSEMYDNKTDLKNFVREETLHEHELRSKSREVRVRNHDKWEKN